MLHARRRRGGVPRARARRAGSTGASSRPTSARDRAAKRPASFLREPEHRPTAITYSNDLMALAGIAVAQRAGLSVPQRSVHLGIRRQRHRALRVPVADLGRDRRGRVGRGRGPLAARRDRRRPRSTTPNSHRHDSSCASPPDPRADRAHILSHPLARQPGRPRQSNRMKFGMRRTSRLPQEGKEQCEEASRSRRSSRQER